MAEYRPANGSCVRCRAALGMAAVKQDGDWYCTPQCADGKPAAVPRRSIPESRLYGVPRRFFRARRPKELRPASPASDS